MPFVTICGSQIQPVVEGVEFLTTVRHQRGRIGSSSPHIAEA